MSHIKKCLDIDGQSFLKIVVQLGEGQKNFELKTEKKGAPVAT